MTGASDGPPSPASSRSRQRPRPSQRAASVAFAIRRDERQRQEGQVQAGHVHSHAIGMNEGMRVLSYLIAGVALYGGIGWLADHLLGTGFWLPAGIVLGAALAVFTIARRFGRVGQNPAADSRRAVSSRPAVRSRRATTGGGAS